MVLGEPACQDSWVSQTAVAEHEDEDPFRFSLVPHHHLWPAGHQPHNRPNTHNPARKARPPAALRLSWWSAPSVRIVGVMVSPTHPHANPACKTRPPAALRLPR
eukprot:354286-Chlamydomonas_euryale.AAC.5